MHFKIVRVSRDVSPQLSGLSNLYHNCSALAILPFIIFICNKPSSLVRHVWVILLQYQNVYNYSLTNEALSSNVMFTCLIISYLHIKIFVNSLFVSGMVRTVKDPSWASCMEVLKGQWNWFGNNKSSCGHWSFAAAHT